MAQLLLTAFGVHIASLRAWRLEQYLQHRLWATRDADELHLLSNIEGGRGADKTAYVLAMMARAKLINIEDAAPFIARFDRLDRNGDGRIEPSDLGDARVGCFGP